MTRRSYGADGTVETRAVPFAAALAHVEGGQPGEGVQIISFSSPEDPQWSGVAIVPPHGTFEAPPALRSDYYLLRGTLSDARGGRWYGPDTYLVRGAGTTLVAGSSGALAFTTRARADEDADDTIVSLGPTDLSWRPGRVPGMRVAPLDLHQRTILVAWRPGTRVAFHDHPRGEEILVLHGELCDQRGKYPAGTWQRLYPQTGHQPYAEVDTLVLLRNGHLRP